MEQLRESLLSLRLKGFAHNLDNRIREALAAGLSYQEFLQLLVEDEKVRRQGNAFQLRLKASGLKPAKTLDNYKFHLQPSVDQKQISQIATCEFIKAKEKIILVGQSGVGKSHLVNGIGLKAIEKGYTVLRFNANDLASQLLQAQKDQSYHEFVARILKADFVIWDEFAIRPFPPGGLEELFALLEKIDESSALALTSNRDFVDWKPFFADNTIASAFTDRVVNKASIIKIVGTSYRIRHFQEKAEENSLQ